MDCWSLQRLSQGIDSHEVGGLRGGGSLPEFTKYPHWLTENPGPESCLIYGPEIPDRLNQRVPLRVPLR